MTTIYHFDAQTGAYLGESLADLCQVTQQPLVPAYATLKPAPDVVEGLARRFSTSDDDWMVEVVQAGEPVPSVEVPPLSEEQRQALLTSAVQEFMDAKARSWGYDNIFSAVSYAAFPSEDPQAALFQVEGTALGAWRSAVWAACYAIQKAVNAGARAEPSIGDLLAELPLAPARPQPAEEFEVTE